MEEGSSQQGPAKRVQPPNPYEAVPHYFAEFGMAFIEAVENDEYEASTIAGLIAQEKMACKIFIALIDNAMIKLPNYEKLPDKYTKCLCKPLTGGKVSGDKYINFHFWNNEFGIRITNGVEFARMLYNQIFGGEGTLTKGIVGKFVDKFVQICVPGTIKTGNGIPFFNKIENDDWGFKLNYDAMKPYYEKWMKKMSPNKQ